MAAILKYSSFVKDQIANFQLGEGISESGPLRKIALGTIAIFLGYSGVDLIYRQYKRQIYNGIRARKTLENKKSIEEMRKRTIQNKPTDSEVERITRLSVTDLVRELKEGTIRPIDALRAYQVEALRAHDRTNCLIEAIVEAEERAIELERDGKRDGILWGVPISIKDDVGIKGYDNALGMVVGVGNPRQDTSTFLEILMHHGAVPFVKTNVPQTEMSLEPGNPINGTVHNPYDLKRGPGASSAGEGALIASHGSPLGIGSDIAGSIRAPAAFCGIQGFKPTTNRMTFQNMSFDGPMMITELQGTWGNLSPDVDGLVLAMRCLWEDCLASRRDTLVPWQPFDHKEFSSNRKLKIGYYTENPLFPTFSACKRAVLETVELLRNQGHEVVEWNPVRMEDTMKLGFKLIHWGQVVDLLKYDIIDPTIQGLCRGGRLPDAIRKFLDFFITPMCRSLSDQLGIHDYSNDLSQEQVTSFELMQMRREVHQSWTTTGLDAIISPVNIMVAPPLGNATLLRDTWVYTFYYNLLNYPSGSVNVSKVSEADLENLDTDYPNFTTDHIHREAKAAMQSSGGMPVGVMVATPRYRDELCLRVMKIIEQNQMK